MSDFEQKLRFIKIKFEHIYNRNNEIEKPVRNYNNDQIEISLQKWLKESYPLLNFLKIQTDIRKKHIRINNKRVDRKYILKVGDIIQIPSDYKLYIDDKIKHNVDISDLQTNKEIIKFKKQLENNIIYADDNLIAINKPPAFATQGGSKIRISLDDMLKYLAKDGEKLKLVHRLDKDTTGVILIARNLNAARKLTLAFKEHKIQKHYLAIVKAIPQKFKGKITSYSDSEGKKQYAETAFKVVATNPKLSYSLILFSPKTGRKHQIRIHAAYYLNAPIVNDSKYGCGIYNSNRYKKARQPEKLSKNKEGLDSKLLGTYLCLHAYQIAIPNLSRGYSNKLSNSSDKAIRITAPLTEHFLRSLEYLELKFNFK